MGEAEFVGPAAFVVAPGKVAAGVVTAVVLPGLVVTGGDVVALGSYFKQKNKS